MKLKLLAAFLLVGIVTACATSPLGRKQLMLLPDSQMDAMGAQSFQQLKSQIPVETDSALNHYVKCVAGPVAEVSKDQANVKNWEIVVFKDPTANAFALPGGKIGVHTGLLKTAKTDSQLAAVIGHEIGHVIARHGNERVSEAFAAQGGLAAIGAITKDNPNSGTLMALLGLGTQFGVMLPHSRTQESEADLIGLDLMARAGFNPQESVTLWQNMKAAGGSAPPEFLSTHPASDSRIASLQEHMAENLPKYEQAKAAGRKPVCARP